MTNKNFDSCTSFLLEDGAFLGRFVRLDDTINTILKKHKYPEQINNVISEFTVLSALLSSSMKFDGLFTLQTQSNGAVPMVVVDVTSENKIRAYCKFDIDRIRNGQESRKKYLENDLRIGNEIIEPTPYVLGAGNIAFTIDQGGKGNAKDLYQGIVDIQGKTLAEIALRYFKQSEQIDTHIKLFLKAPEKAGEKWQAGGLMIQKIPTSGGHNNPEISIEESWNEMKIFAESLKDEEVFNLELSSEDILNRLYHANKLVISNRKDYEFACRCSRNKLLDTLSTFKTEDIDDMVENNKITATCSFCSEFYSFDKGEVLKH